MQFARARKPMIGLDMSPIIDCILQLLIFFMLTSSFSGGAIHLSLPKAVAEQQPERNELVLSINAVGEVFLDQERLQMESLIERVQRELQSNPQLAIVFRGDETMPYREFVEVLDRVKRAGVQRFRIAHAPLPGEDAPR